MNRRIIYDLGANNGDDIPYYLMKSDLVIAVEANPALCEIICKKFENEIQEKRLIIENCVVLDNSDSSNVDFYIHKSDHVLSQFPRPAPVDLMQYEKVVLPAKSISGLIDTYGDPYYIKIDIEHYDSEILRALFSKGIFPPFISAESHSIDIFALLVAQGGYNAFKLVDGKSVSRVYSNRKITCENKQDQVSFSFSYHSAGPFGNDVDGEWMTAENFIKVLTLMELGWKDIHATNIETADPSARIRNYDFILRYAWRMIKARWTGLMAALGLDSSSTTRH